MASRVVVGVDGSEGSVAALRWAMGEAQFRRARLEIIHAWQYPSVGGELTGMYPVDEGAFVTAAHRLLDETIEAAGPPPDGLVMERSAPRGHEVGALLEAAEDADLLVVGSRGRGGFAALLLGSVSQQCVYHAPCPVVVVPARARPPRARSNADPAATR